jgi:hypothetical protein
MISATTTPNDGEMKPIAAKSSLPLFVKTAATTAPGPKMMSIIIPMASASSLRGRLPTIATPEDDGSS